MTDHLLARLETYYDTVPRRHARVKECGPFTVFLGEPGGWTYYARPRLGGTGPYAPADVAAAVARQREEGLPAAIEWVHETTPELHGAVQAEGSLSIEEIPLMVLRAPQPAPAVPVGVRVRTVLADEPEVLTAAQAVANVGFGHPGTASGPQGAAERDEARAPASDRVLALIAEGATVVAVAESEADGVLATGRLNPVDGVAEIVGVATLPAARRRGLGAAVTAALVDAALTSGVGTVFLTAGSEQVARVYAGVGFERVGTGYVAEATNS